MNKLKLLALRQKEDRIFESFILPYGSPFPELIGMYYLCNFNHRKDTYDIAERHYHRVVDARVILRPGHIGEGIAFLDVHDAWHLGCMLKYFYSDKQSGKNIHAYNYNRYILDTK